MEWGVGPGAARHIDSLARQGRSRRHASGAGPLAGELRRLLTQRAVGEPRVVIGIDADEAEYLAEFLDRDECVQRVQIPQQQGRQAELPPERTGEHARSALLGTPVSYGRHSPDRVRDMTTELAGWNPGELPGRVTDQLAAWPPAPQAGADQPPASA